MRQRRWGFTLIELLVVIAIIAVLAAILFPVFARARASARTAKCQGNLKNISVAIKMYKEDWDGFLAFIDDGPNNPMLTWCDFLQPYVKDRGVFICPEHKPNPSWCAVQRVNTGWPAMVRWTSYGMNTIYGSATSGWMTEFAAVTGVGLDLNMPIEPSRSVMVADASWNWFRWDAQDPEQINYQKFERNVTPVPSGYEWAANMIEYRHPRHIVRDGKIVQGGGANFLMADGHIKLMFYPVDATYFDPSLGAYNN